VSSAPPAEEVSFGRPAAVLPPPPAAAQSGASLGGGLAVGSIRWQRIVVGNWVGAGLTAATALGVAGALSLALALMAKPTDFGVDNGLTLVSTLLGAAFGADLVMSLSSEGQDVDASVGMFSLTVTLIALTAAVLVFRRVTARYERGLDAVADAARAALLLGLALMLCAIIFRGDNDEMGRGWGAELSADRLGVEGSYGPSIAGALFLGFLVLFTTLVVVCFATRRDWWPAPVQRVHDWLAAPLYGLGTILLALPVAGLIGLVLLIVTGDTLDDNDPTDDDLAAGIALIFGLLASGGFWLISLGGGAAYGTSSHERAGGSSESSSEMHRLAHYAQDTPSLWAAPVVMLVVLLLAAYVVRRRTRAPERVIGNLAVFVALLLVALPLVSRLTSLHAGVSGSDGNEPYRSSFYIGQVGWQATLLLALAALVCAALVAVTGGGVDRAQLRGQAAAVARRLQADPGRPAGSPTPHPAPPPASPPTPPVLPPPPSWTPDDGHTRFRPPAEPPTD
jgi:hypothetical protein